MSEQIRPEIHWHVAGTLSGQPSSQPQPRVVAVHSAACTRTLLVALAEQVRRATCRRKGSYCPWKWPTQLLRRDVGEVQLECLCFVPGNCFLVTRTIPGLHTEISLWFVPGNCFVVTRTISWSHIELYRWFVPGNFFFLFCFILFCLFVCLFFCCCFVVFLVFFFWFFGGGGFVFVRRTISVSTLIFTFGSFLGNSCFGGVGGLGFFFFVCLFCLLFFSFFGKSNNSLLTRWNSGAASPDGGCLKATF